MVLTGPDLLAAASRVGLGDRLCQQWYGLAVQRVTPEENARKDGITNQRVVTIKRQALGVACQ